MSVRLSWGLDDCAHFALAFAVKVPLFPLHGWLPDAYRAAPAALLVTFAGVMAKTGAYAIIRNCEIKNFTGSAFASLGDHTRFLNNYVHDYVPYTPGNQAHVTNKREHPALLAADAAEAALRGFAAVFFRATGRATRRGFAFFGSFIVASIFTSCSLSSRHTPGVSFGSEIGPMATRLSLETGCPTA